MGDKYRIVQRVKAAEGYDVLNVNTPFDVITLNNVSVSNGNLVATTHLNADAFMGTEFTLSLTVPSNIADVTGKFNINGINYDFDATCLSLLKASAGLSVILRTSRSTVWFYNQVVAKALDSENVDASKITGVLAPANGGTGQTTLQATRKAMGLGDTLGALPAANGGTGQTSLQATRKAMGLGDTLSTLPVANGGTGQTTLQALRNAMGLGNTTGALPVANGGTGATTVAGAKTNLGWINYLSVTGSLPTTGWTFLSTNKGYTYTVSVTTPGDLSSRPFMVDIDLSKYNQTNYQTPLREWGNILQVTSTQSATPTTTTNVVFMVKSNAIPTVVLYYKMVFFY